MYTVFYNVSIMGITDFVGENSLFLYRESTNLSSVSDNPGHLIEFSIKIRTCYKNGQILKGLSIPLDSLRGRLDFLKD